MPQMQHQGGQPRPQQKQQKISHCHKMIRAVAIEICGAQYDEFMKDDLLWSAWKAKHPGTHPKVLERLFLEKYWGDYIQVARATLARMLEYPIDENQKELIMEALILDNSLIAGRANPQVVLGQK